MGGERSRSEEKSKSGTFPPHLEIPQERRDSHFFHRPGDDDQLWKNDNTAAPLDSYAEASSSVAGVGGLIQTAVGWGGCFGRAWVKRSGLRA
jgi:hypothetical protein